MYQHSPLAIAAGKIILILSATSLSGCAEKPSAVVPMTPKQAVSASQPAQETFATPQAAIDAFIDAARSADVSKLTLVLGPDGNDVIASGDAVADETARDWFIKAYDQHHELTAKADGANILNVGSSQWPMPIPLVHDSAGWRFDTAAGKDEILNRRIGRDELAAIQVCHAIVDAQQEYAMADADHDGVPAYAEHFASHPQKKDGLFWPITPGETPSPLGPLFADAADEGYSTTQTAIGPRRPYHGYFYRMLKAQGPAATGGAMDYHVGGHMIGGFGVVAWPAYYGNSGVMTFIVNQQGVIYQQNLGDQTEQIARAMTAFDPSPEWTKIETATTTAK